MLVIAERASLYCQKPKHEVDEITQDPAKFDANRRAEERLNLVERVITNAYTGVVTVVMYTIDSVTHGI